MVHSPDEMILARLITLQWWMVDSVLIDDTELL